MTRPSPQEATQGGGEVSVGGEGGRDVEGAGGASLMNASTIDAYANGYDRARSGGHDLPPKIFTLAARVAWIEGYLAGEQELGASA